MWARWLEIALGVWLLASPWIFDGSPSEIRLASIAAGFAVIALAAASFASRTEWAHLVIGGVAVLLGGAAYLGFERPGPPGAQNLIVAALLLLTVCVIPNRASEPPPGWNGR